eukprot:9042199-Pyramimonas_sp.AAC.1
MHGKHVLIFALFAAASCVRCYQVQGSTTSFSKQMRTLASGHWEAVPEELIEHVFFTQDEKSMLSCLRQNRTTLQCRDLLKIAPSKRVPFFGPIGKASHLCRYLNFSDVALQFRRDHHKRFTKAEASWGSRVYGQGLPEYRRELPGAVAAWCALDGRSLGFVGDST